MTDWNGKDKTPPDGVDLEVIDKDGNIRWAIPAYTPFEIKFGKIVDCEPIFEGFLVGVGFGDKFGDVIGWRIAENDDTKNKSKGWISY